MNRSLLLTAFVAIALPLALAGCGNKGALVLPGTPADAAAPATDAPAADAPTVVPEAPAQPPPAPVPAKGDGGTPAR